eukprot:5142177-Prymnesium_polylepis.1
MTSHAVPLLSRPSAHERARARTTATVGPPGAQPVNEPFTIFWTLLGSPQHLLLDGSQCVYSPLLS